MESLVKPDKSIIDIGREFAFEGLEPEYFQSKSPEELAAFNIGYQEGLSILRERQMNSDLVEPSMQEEMTGRKK